MVAQKLAPEHYDILQILFFAKHGGVATDLGFTLHDLGGQTLMMSLPELLKPLKKADLIKIYKNKPYITKKGELVWANRKTPKKFGRIYFTCQIMIVPLIPHSVCVVKKGLMAAGIPRIMIKNWSRAKKMIEFRPECRFRRRRDGWNIRYGLLMDAFIPAKLVKKSEWSLA